jgi:type I restriction enzyme R subunit
MSKLDNGGFYTQLEVDAVVSALTRPNALQSELVAAIQPISTQLLRRYREALSMQQRLQQSGADDTTYRMEVEALVQMRADMQTYVRLYTFMSQMFDFGNPEFHKRMLLYRMLLPLLAFEHTRPDIDLSYVALTSYNLRKLNEAHLALDNSNGDLEPATGAGTGQMRDAERQRLAEIIRQVNELFKGDLTDTDMLTYVNTVLKEKLLESAVLRQQAQQNSREQFANSPDLQNQLFEAIIAAMAAHETMSRQALNDQSVLQGILRILLGPVGLYEALRGPQADA